MSGDREEIERIKADMRRARRIQKTTAIIKAWLGSPEHRAIAAAELDAEEAPPEADPPASTGSEASESIETPASLKILAGYSRERLIEMVAADKGTGSKARIAKQLGVSVATLKRRWREVAPNEQWPGRD